MSGEPDLDKVLDHFALFAESVQDLPLYGAISRSCSRDAAVAGLLLAAQPGQARPVLLLAAVHHLLLGDPDLPLAQWYPTIASEATLRTDDPWPTFRTTCLAHREELTHLISTRTTQTNEVNRVVLLAPMVAEATRDLATMPVSLVELGSSAGLLLGLEHYRIDVGGTVIGDPASPVRVAGEVHGDGRPELDGFPPDIVDRIGIDRAPVRLDDRDAVRWLEACLWPDQPWRVQRFRDAVSCLRADPPDVVEGDFVSDLGDVVATLDPTSHLVVFDGWALTYVARADRPKVVASLEGLAADGRPVSWISAEAPKCVPGIAPPHLDDVDEGITPETVLGLRRWREGRELPPATLGWAHAHGAWLRWIPEAARSS